MAKLDLIELAIYSHRKTTRCEIFLIRFCYLSLIEILDDLFFFLILRICDYWNTYISKQWMTRTAFRKFILSELNFVLCFLDCFFISFRKRERFLIREQQFIEFSHVYLHFISNALFCICNSIYILRYDCLVRVLSPLLLN